MITDVHNVTIAEAVTVMLFSMAIVFFVLLIISFLMDGIRIVFGEKEQKQVVKEITPRPEKAISKDILADEENENEEELVAIITAAIASELSCSTRDIRLKSIKRKYTPAQPWAEAGKHENMLNRI